MLVTGAGGFIGSHLAGRLIEAGAEVRALLRYTSERRIGALRWEPAASEAEVHFGDLRDPGSVESAAAGCDTIFHLGASVSVPYSFVAPREFVETNVLGTLNVLLAARTHGAERTVCTSSSEVYGSPATVPILEDHPISAQSAYAASKAGADQLAGSFNRSHGLPVGIVRPFNTYGPRQSARAVIPTILTQAIAGQRLQLGSLDPVRDLTFVSDIVAGLLAFGCWDEMAGQTLQLGSGESASVGELVKLIGEVLGRELEVEPDEQRVRPHASEVERLISDSSAAARELDWRPEVTLRDGLQRTAEWVEAHLDWYRPGEYAV